MSSEKNPTMLSCVILPVTMEYGLLLPDNSMVGIVGGEGIDIVVDPQGGLIGKLHWNGWHVPLLSFDAASRGGIPKFNMKTKTVIVHSLSGDPRMPYLALTVQGVPRRLMLQQNQLHASESEDTLVVLTLMHEGVKLLIPDLAALVRYVQARLSQ